MKIIGSVTRYLSNEHPYLQGVRVMVIAIHHGALTSPDRYEILRTDVDIAAAGDVDPDADLVEVAPMKGDGTPSFVTSDARVADLELFRGE